MIIAEVHDARTNQLLERRNILIIDGHSHMGQDEDGQKMMNPMAPGGTYDFYARFQARLQQKFKEEGFEYQLNDWIYRFRISPFPHVHAIFKRMSTICRCGKHVQMFQSMNNSWLVDQGVVFPFHDTFRDKRPEALFRASNYNIARNTTTFPNSLRLIGYGRCDPQEREKAVNEIKFGAEVLGLRGWKLHPRSELWLDKVQESFVTDVLVELAKHSMPVLFDTRGKKSILDIWEAIKLARKALERINKDLIPHLKVIIGHCAAGNIGDEDIYEAIADPNSIGEISMMHGGACSQFYTDFMNWYKQRYPERERWSRHLIFGSDYPYFFEKHAADNLFYLLSPEFMQAGGTLDDFQNIMGLNQIRLLPEYNFQHVQKTEVPNARTVCFSQVNEASSLDMTGETLAALVEFNLIDIRKILPVFQNDFKNFINNVMIEVSPKKDSKQRSMILALNFIGTKVKLVKVLQKGDQFRPLGGYKFFDHEDKLFLMQNAVTCPAAVNAFHVLKETFQ
ncbi:MAG: amidohydrolase family protein [Candidatus Helarchaeales archaeon]